MNKKSTLPLVLFILLVFLTGTPPPSATALDRGRAASGEGQFTFNGEQVDFSFDADANKNGVAKGRALFETAQTSVEVKIDCLNVQSFAASMSGTVKKSDDPAFPKHAQVVFAAFDGDLLGGRPDEITPLFLIPDSELDCNELTPLTILPLDQGEIRIR